jgi:Uma2 family endonuclease
LQHSIELGVARDSARIPWPLLRVTGASPVNATFGACPALGLVLNSSGCPRRSAVSVQYARRFFSVAEFDQMVEAGVFREDDRLELIDGEIIEMSPIGKRHAACVRKAARTLTRLLGERTLVSVQSPVEAGLRSEPQPDLALLVPRADFYEGLHPGPRHVQLLVEVADTSLEYDVKVKVPMYARAGYKEVWVVDLGARAVRVFSRLSGGTYRAYRVYARGERIEMRRFAGAMVAVSDLVL